MLSSSDIDMSSSSDEEMLFEILEHLPRPRIFRDRSNPLEEFDEFNFKCRFRFSKTTFMHILNIIGPEFEKLRNRSMAVSTSNQLLITFRYYATGAFQATLGDDIQIHKSTVCRIIKQVTMSIAALRERFIQMPNRGEILTIKQDFYSIRNFPNVIGAIDCSHMRIQSPGGNLGEMFRNRKSYFSINVQAVCTANLKIIDIVARWPGSVHDSTIFDSSQLRAKFENNEFPDCFLLGDSGYPCRAYLLTPLLNPVTEGEVRYQQAQIATRNPVERLFVVWKKRFPCLSLGMRTIVDTTLTTIVATAVLHKISLQHNEELPPNDPDVDIENNFDIDIPIGHAQAIGTAGHAIRTSIINNVFSQ